MGGKASKGTPADRRLKENRGLGPRPMPRPPTTKGKGK